MNSLFFLLLIAPVFMYENLSATIISDYKAHAAYERQDFDVAESNYIKNLEQEPDDAISNYNVGTTLYKKKKYVEAKNHFERAIKNAIDNKTLLEKSLFNQGNSLVQMGAYEGAIESYEKALEVNPENESAQKNMALARELLEEQKQKEEEQKKEDQQKDQQQDDSDKENQDKDKKEDDQKDGNEKDDKNDSQQQDKSAGKDEKDPHQKGKNDEGKDGEKQKSEQLNSGNDKQDQCGNDTDQEQSNQNDVSAGEQKKEEVSKGQQGQKQNAQEQKTQPSSKSKEQELTKEKRGKEEQQSREDVQKQESENLQNSAEQQKALQDQYAAQMNADPALDDRFSKKEAMLLQALSNQEDAYQKELLRMNVSKEGKKYEKNW